MEGGDIMACNIELLVGFSADRDNRVVKENSQIVKLASPRWVGSIATGEGTGMTPASLQGVQVVDRGELALGLRR